MTITKREERVTMTFELRSTEPKPDIPKPKSIHINGVLVGNVEPKLYGDELHWHSVIRLEDRRLSGTRLVQGHGGSPHKAIANSIIDARAARDAFIERLAELEANLGVAGKTDDEIRKWYPAD